MHRYFTVLNLMFNILAFILSIFLLVKIAMLFTALPFLVMLLLIVVCDGFIIATSLNLLKKIKEEKVD